MYNTPTKAGAISFWTVRDPRTVPTTVNVVKTLLVTDTVRVLALCRGPLTVQKLIAPAFVVISYRQYLCVLMVCTY